MAERPDAPDQLSALPPATERLNKSVGATLARLIAFRAEVEAFNGTDYTPLLRRLALMQADLKQLEAEDQRIRSQTEKLTAEGEYLVDIVSIIKKRNDDLASSLKKFKEIAAEVEKLKKRRNDPKGLGRYTVFQDTNMAMQFRFEIHEDNNASANGSFVWPVHIGTLTLGYSGGSERERRSERWVSVSANFSDLLKLTSCAANGDVADSYRARMYPITGNIGIAELVRQYLIVNDRATFELNPKDSKKIFSDKLLFTTVLHAGVKPSLSLSPAIARTIKFDADLNADRKDIHELIVDIGPGTSAPKAADAKAAVSNLDINTMPDLNIRLVRDPEDEALSSSDGSSWRTRSYVSQ
jgi:hypothetical protein